MLYVAKMKQDFSLSNSYMSKLTINIWLRSIQNNEAAFYSDSSNF